MDRRRFSPSAEGLEGRALLSLFGGSSSLKRNTTVSVQDLPKTYKQKELRIAHLPFYLQQEDPRRFLPPATIAQLQTDMNSVVSELHAPSTAAVDSFNTELRHLFPYNTLSPVNAKLINHSFGAVMEHAGATPEQVANLKADMNALAKVDSLSVNPSQLAREDYAVVLQTTLAVGRPMITPNAPSLRAADGKKIDGGRAGSTHLTNPSLVGTYPAGATADEAIRVQIVDQNGHVLGTSTVNNAGLYTVKLTTPLSDGKYLLKARSVDEVGHLSADSHAFTLFVKTTPPAASAQAQVLVSPPATVYQTPTSLAPVGGPLALK